MMEEEIKNLAWNTFKQTGNINTFMEFKQFENMEKEKNKIKPEDVMGYINKQEL